MNPSLVDSKLLGKYRLLSIVVGCMISFSLQAKTPSYQMEALSFFDNREYKRSYQTPQTLFGVRLSPEIAWLSEEDANRCSYGIHFGASWMQEMGATLNESYLVPTAYCSYSKQAFSISLGSLPYSHLQQALPHFLHYDSLCYYRPNIQGALLQYTSSNGFVDVICDWRARQSITRNEAFRLVINGQRRFKACYLGGRFQMNHLASKLNSKTGVCDDIVFNPYLGCSLPLLDSMSVQIGYILEYEWDRATQQRPNFPQGILLESCLRWKGFEWINSFYAGTGLMPLYETKHSLLYQGDPFYRASCYNRCDLKVTLIHHRLIDCFFSWNIHLTNTAGLNHQQQLIFRINTAAAF